MNKWTVCEVAQAVAKQLGREFHLEPSIPLEMKLKIEQLRLAELVAEAERQHAASGPLARVAQGSQH
jgi:hypothetical protein